MRLNKRQQHEKLFHDSYAARSTLLDVDLDAQFSPAAMEHRYAKRIFKDVKGKKVLDLGCGFGETAVYWAREGADVEGIDISPGMVAIAQKLVQNYAVTKNCHIQQMAAERLDFPSNSFDYIFGDGILHHVDFMHTLKEVKRVLKDGGIAIFVEPLAYNPVINMYRTMALEVRTDEERPLRFDDLQSMKTIFPTLKHREYHFFTLGIFLWYYCVNRIHPNQERYWRKLRKTDGVLGVVLQLLSAIDTITLSLCPPLRKLCWNTVITLRK